MGVSSSSSLLSSFSKGMNLLILWCGWVYVVGDVEFSHSCVDKYAIVSKASHKENYPSRYVVAPLIVDGILRTGTRFLGYMDCGLVVDGGEQNQRTGSRFDSEVGVILCVHGLKPELW